MKNLAVRILVGSTLALGSLTTPAIAEEGVDSFLLKDLDAARLAEAREAFVRHNPTSGWKAQNVHVFPKSGFVWRVLGRNPATSEPTAEAAVTLAKAFLEHNRAFLGLEDVHGGNLEIRYQKSLLSNVNVETRHPVRYSGYESVADFGYRVRIFLQVDAQGVRSVINQTDRLPSVFPRLHTKAAVSFQAPRILEQMVGRELFYHDFAGKPRSAGRVEAIDIQSAALTISTEHVSGHDGLWVGLTWSYRVERNGLPWTFVFSARTGELVAIKQGFAT